MPIATFAAGPYAATYNADSAPGTPAGKGQGVRDLGLVEDVRRWQRVLETQPVRAAATGESVLDDIYRGGQCICQMTFKEWKPATRDALWPFSESFGHVGAIGRLLTDLAGVLTLTAQPGTLAASGGPATLTFGKAILAPEQVVSVPLGPVPRDVPVIFRCYPYLNATGQLVWFEESE